MEFIDNAKQAVFEDESLLSKTAIGTLILFTSIFIFPYFIYQGYLVKILKHTDSGDVTSLPEWTNFGTLFKDGLIAFFISLLISLPGLILNLVPQLAGLSDTLILLGSAVGSIVSFITSYLLIAIYTVGFRDGFGEAFSFSRLKPILLSKEYLVYWGVAFLIGLGVGIVAIPLVLFTFGFGMILLVPVVVVVNFGVMALAGFAITEVEAPTQSTATTDPTQEMEM